MKKITIFVLLAALLIITGVVAANEPGDYRALLTGMNEVPPVRTSAHGRAIFELSDDGTTLHYQVKVSGLVDTLMAHIHLAPPGVNGDVVVWLYPEAPPPQLIPGHFSGILAEGEITAEDLVGPMAGMTIADLVAEIEAGNTYVNVHTEANPGGEIRGQIR